MSEQRARLLRDLAARFGVRGVASGDDEIDLMVAPTLMGGILDTLLENGAEPLGVWGDTGSVVHYLLGLGGENLRFVVTQQPATTANTETTLASLAAAHPTFLSGEREVAESFGVSFTGHPDPRPLLLRNGGNPTPQTSVVGGGITRLRVGPIGSGIEESRRMELALIGSRIIHAESVPGIKHRGAEARVVGLSPLAATAVVARICGRCSLANTVAFVGALERMSECDLPLRVIWIRTALLEIERIGAHAEAIADIAEACDHAEGARRAWTAREGLLRALELAFGSRFARGVIIPGGIARDLPQDHHLRTTTAQVAVELRGLVHDLLDLPPVRAQLKDCGTITPQVARELALTGPVARAAGSRRDVRLAYPYLAYGELKPWAPVHVGGDALARLRVMHEELEQSAILSEELLRHMPPGGLGRPLRDLPPNRRGLGLVESPRGATLQVVYSDRDGRVRHYWMRGASDVNALALPMALLDHDLTDYRRIVASLALCAACIDR